MELNALDSIFGYLGFYNSNILREFCVFIGVLIIGYQSHIRKLTRDLLKELNDNTKEGKFCTKHIVIAKVFRLRYELKKLKNSDRKNMLLFNDTQKTVLEKFWEVNILNFDKEQNANGKQPE